MQVAGIKEVVGCFTGATKRLLSVLLVPWHSVPHVHSFRSMPYAFESPIY